MAVERVHDDSNALADATQPVPAGDEQLAALTAPVPSSDRVRDILTSKHERSPGQLDFNSREHKKYGDEGSETAGHKQPYTPPPKAHDPHDNDRHVGFTDRAYEFALTPGDLQLLSADYFEPREVDAHGHPIPDNLFRIAQIPSTAPGTQVGTRDEILYALHDGTRGGDPRFAAGGPWEKIKFSDAVKTAVLTRYRQLAARNYDHYASPDGKLGGPKSPDGSSAGGSYHALHEAALLRAHKAALTGQSIDDALAHEAAAQHYLTDAFAAGHLRTPRKAIETYWNGKYPLFFENTKKSIARDTAIQINKGDSKVLDIATVLDIMGPILDQIDEQTATLPAFGFDGIISDIMHDEDNAIGLDVTNDAGQRWHAFGDSHGNVVKPKPQEGPTKQHVEEAVSLGVGDVKHAYEFVFASKGVASDAQTLAHVRATTPSPAAAGKPKYGPEQLMPFPDPKANNGDLAWKQPDLGKLWSTRVRSDQPLTFGQAMIDSVASGDLHDWLDEVANKFPERDTVLRAEFFPRKAFKDGFLKPLETDTRNKLQTIIDYDPAVGQNSSRDDDATRADMDRLKQQGLDMQAQGVPGADKDTQLRGLTLPSRVEYVKNLESFQGKGTTEHEQDLILDIFRTAPPADRKALYKLLEKHEWDGSLNTGRVLGDELWKNLDHDHIVKFEAMMNGKK